VFRGSCQREGDRSKGGAKEVNLLREARAAHRGTERLDGHHPGTSQMDQGIAGKSETKVEAMLSEIGKQVFMGKATIRKPRDHLVCGENGTELREHRFIGSETDLGALVAQGAPGQGDRPAPIQHGEMNKHKGSEHGRIQSHVERLLGGPANKSCLDHRSIPV
jgi:hypothetical protein